MNDCMVYTGYLNHDGYAYSHGKQVVRTLWEKHFEKIPEGQSLAHICDMRACINLAHVYLATHAENMADRYLHKGKLPVRLNPEYRRRQYTLHRGSNVERTRRYYAQNRESILRKARERYARGR